MNRERLFAFAAAMTVTAACSNTAGFDGVQGYGPNATLPEPDTSLIPTIGRPVGVALDAHGGLLVADDVGNAVWRVSGASVMTRR